MSGISLLPENLDELDRMDRDLLVLTFFSDEKPLQGLNSLVDWRMNGRLSRLLMDSTILGQTGEKILLNTNRKIQAKRLLVYGLGQRSHFDNSAFIQSCKHLLSIIKGLKAESWAMNVPGTSNRGSEYFLERSAILMKEIRGQYAGNVSLFIGGKEPFKELRPKLDLILKEIDKLNNGRKGKHK